MNETPMHILTQMGILTSFSLSKKITEKELADMMHQEKNKGKSEEEIVSIMGDKIMGEIMDAVRKGQIPGVIINQGNKPIISVKNVEELNRLVMVLAGKLKGKKYDKLSLCYFINYLVHAMGLSEEDFEEFHRRMKEANGDDDDDDDDD